MFDVELRYFVPFENDNKVDVEQLMFLQIFFFSKAEFHKMFLASRMRHVRRCYFLQSYVRRLHITLMGRYNIDT